MIWHCITGLSVPNICQDATSYARRKESTTRQLWKPTNSHIFYLPKNIVLLKLHLNNFNLHSFGLLLWGRTYFSTHFVYINGVRCMIEILLHLPVLVDFQIIQKEYFISSYHLTYHSTQGPWLMVNCHSVKTDKQ